MHEMARYRQADMLREAQRARLAQLAGPARAERRGLRLPRLRTRPVLRAAADR